MPKLETVHKKVAKICLSFPDTEETITWGKPHFRVGDKIFAGLGEEDGEMLLGLKLGMDRAAEIVQQDGFRKAKYVGHKGWISIDMARIKDWKLIKEMLTTSYCLIAPKRSLKKLDG